MILTINNESTYTISDFTSNSFLMDCPTFLEATNAYQDIAANLAHVTVEKDGEVVYSAEGLTSDGLQITPTSNGYTAIIYFHGAKASGADSEYAEIGRILMGEEA